MAENDIIKKDSELAAFIEGIREIKQTNPEVFEILRDIGRKKGLIA